MSNLALCRVCLASNTKMQNIANTLYQKIFEKLSTKLQTKDKRPETICYICYAQLRRCAKFIKMSLKAEDILTQFAESGIELTEETVNILDRKLVHKLSCTQLQSLSLYEAVDPKVKAEVTEEHCDSAVDENLIYIEPINVKNEVQNEEPVNETEEDARGIVIVKEEIDIASVERIIKTEEFTVIEKVSVKVEQVGQEASVKGDSDAECELQGVRQEKRSGISIANPDLMERRRFTCKHCDKSYIQKCHLYRHFQTTHCGPTKPVRRNFCEVCGKSFNQKSSLKKHLLNHDGVKQFTCDFCPARCSQKIDLVRHMRIHSGEKPFTCDICKESFSRKNNLKLHILTHADKKPFICLICKSSFSRKSDVTRHHKRKHTGEKPFSCDLCDFRSGNASYMKTHVENKHTKQLGKPHS